MPISPYVQRLREQVGSARLLLPSVSVHLFDGEGRLLLVRLGESGTWSTPGGSIEPDESPADAAVREAWEETGVLVRPEYVSGVYGGPECVVRYPNGDESQYVIIAFECSVISGIARPDQVETDAVRYWSRSEAEELPLAPWLRAHLPLVFDRQRGHAFTGPTWQPTGE